jgi:hypothetical protein
MVTYTGKSGELWFKSPNATTWVDLGPAGFASDPVAPPSEAYIRPPEATSIAMTARIPRSAWNRVCRAFGIPEWQKPASSTPLRRRKHGGQWQNYRDVRTKWQAVRCD